jgi:peroxiredoxin
MSVTSNRLKLLAIAALFLIPLVSAVMMFKGQLPLLSGETVNQGMLVQPPVPLDWTQAQSSDGQAATAELLGKWVVLFPMGAACDADCLHRATGLRQVHRASGREQQRIELVLLSPQAPDSASREKLLEVYDRFQLLEDTRGSLHEAVQTALSRLEGDVTSPALYLVDPLGNIMMAYAAENAEVYLSKDLKRLLKWSKQD